MSSERRLLIAVSLSFLILLLYPVYLKWISPPPVPLSESEQVATVFETVSRVRSPGSVPVEQATASPRSTTSKAPVVRNENVYEFSNAMFNVQFSDHGAVMTQLDVKAWSRAKTTNGEAALIRARGRYPSSAFLVELPNQGIDFKNQIFSLEALNERTGEARFVAEAPGQWRIAKHYQFNNDEPVFHLDVAVENLTGTTRAATLSVTSDLDVDVENLYDRNEAKVYSDTHDKLTAGKLDKIAKKPLVSEGEILWQALARKHFAIVVEPDAPAALSKVWARAVANEKDAHVMHATLTLSLGDVQPGQKVERSFLVYAGPQYYANLKSLDRGFERILSHGFFGTFKLWLLVALLWTYGLVGNYGWAIILVTAAIKLLFTPFTHMSFQSMKKMQQLQPKIKVLQEQLKGDQAKLSQEMMALYKRHKVNPMGGCLPMLLQIPVFIAFYQVLVQTVELKGAPFIFWIADLSEPDRLATLPFSLPFLGDGLNLLPVLMLASMIWQQKLTPQTGSPEQQKMMMFMPIIFGFIFYSLPSGLVLYWLVNNVLSILHQLFIKGKALPHHEES